MFESALLTESAWGTGVQDPLTYLQFPSGRAGDFGGYLPSRSTIQDYAHGDFRPFWFNWDMHSAHRADCRMVCQAITLSHNIAENLENYVIGQGFTYKAKSRSANASVDRLLVNAVQADIDRIIQDNNVSEVDLGDGGHELGSLESQIHNRSRRDGEDFIGIFSPKRGEIELRLINAEHIVDPQGANRFERALNYPFAQSWKYGIHTADHDVQRTLGYYVQWDEMAMEESYFPANDWSVALKMRSGLMHHVKRNVDIKVKRGMSDFFPVSKQIVDDAKLLRNVTTGAQVQAAIAWIVQHANEHSSVSEVSRELSTTSDHKNSVRSSSGTYQSEYRRTVNPGTVLNIDKGKEYKPGPLGAERNAGFGLVATLSVRRIGIRWNMPEYMISADSSNGNRATTEVAEGPFEKSRRKDQGFYSGHFRAVIWKAISILVAQGFYLKYGIATLKDLRTRINIFVTTPEVASRDQYEAAQANEILSRNNVLSTTTWRAQTELDPDQEDMNIRKEIADGLRAPLGQPVSPTSGDGGEAAPSTVLALNGAQITAASDMLSQVSAGLTSPIVASELLQSLQVSPEKTERMVKAASEMAVSTAGPPAMPPATGGIPKTVRHAEQRISEQDVNRIASRVQMTLWEKMESAAEGYP